MESFLVAVNAVIPFFCYLALGYTMKIRGVVKEEFLQKLNQMVFRVFYPFMTFYNIYKADAESLPRPLLLVFTGASILIVEAILIVIIPKIVKENPRRGVIIQGDLSKQLCPVRTAAHNCGIWRFSGVDRGYDGYGRCVDLQYHIGIYS